MLKDIAQTGPFMSRAEWLAANLGADSRWGKLERQTEDALSVAELQARAEALAHVFGGDGWKRSPRLLYISVVDIQSRVSRIEEILPNPKWKKHNPGLLVFPIQALNSRFSNLIGVLGLKEWGEKMGVRLLNLSEETILHRAQVLTLAFGSEVWKSTPNILMISPERIEIQVAGFNAAMGVRWKDKPGLLLHHQAKLIEERVRLLDEVLGNEKWLGNHFFWRFLNIPLERIQQNVQALDKIFDRDNWTKYEALLLYSPDVLHKRAQQLTDYFGGEHWKRYPQMIIAVGSLHKNGKAVDAIFGNHSWARNPQLVLSSPETLATYAQDHTKNFGSEAWMANPVLITVTPRTFNVTLALLRRIGIPVESNLPLLATTARLKRQKAKFIREKILMHKHVFISTIQSLDDKSSLVPVLSELELEEETQEIQEFFELIRRFPRILTMSEKAMLEWANKDGLPQIFILVTSQGIEP